MGMMQRPDILCVGSVLWDIIGTAPVRMKAGYDLPGQIIRTPGGVAMNIARTLARFGLRPALLSVVGTDDEGDALVARAEADGLIAAHLLRKPGATDRYMAVEGANGLIAAIADAASLEAAGADILTPLADGRLGSADQPWCGPVAVDGNLTEEVLALVATSPLFAQADLRVAPASPGKARRLVRMLPHRRVVMYLNLIEANLILQAHHESTQPAAEAMLALGAGRVLVTDGANPATEASADGARTVSPPPVTVRRVTGAGDTFMAAHIAAELQGALPGAALDQAVAAAAEHISKDE